MTAVRKIGDVMRKYNIRSIYILIILYVLFVAINKPVFLSLDNCMNLLRQVSVYGIMACGITFVMLTGRTDLSAGMLISLLCEISCWFVIDGIDNQFLAIVVPILLGAICGLINGVLVGVIKLNSFVATMGTMSVFSGLGLLFYNNADNLWGSPEATFYEFLGRGSVLGIPMPVIVFAVVAVLSAVVLKKTVFGQQIYAVGGNIVNARFSGVNPTFIITMAYVIAGALTGLASVVMTARIMTINTKMGAGYEFTCLTAIVLGGLALKGGKGTIGGTIIGVLILGIVDNSFTILGVNAYLQYVVEGLILAVTVGVQVLGERRKGQ